MTASRAPCRSVFGPDLGRAEPIVDAEFDQLDALGDVLVERPAGPDAAEVRATDHVDRALGAEIHVIVLDFR